MSKLGAHVFQGELAPSVGFHTTEGGENHGIVEHFKALIDINTAVEESVGRDSFIFGECG